jgi:hypothetical protein
MPSDPSDINSPHSLDYTYKLKNSIKFSYQAKIDQLIRNHEKFSNSLVKEISSNYQKIEVENLKNKKPTNNVSYEKAYYEVHDSITETIFRLRQKYFKQNINNKKISN